jgi:hypothetical protein
VDVEDDYDYFDHDADTGVIGRGATLQEAFEHAAEATFALMCDPMTVERRESIAFDFAAYGAGLAVNRLPFRALTPIALAFFEWLEAFGLIAFFVQLPLTLIPIILDWELRWYIVTDRSLRIREGVWKVSEMTMTFANVQEVSIHQGPLERLFGVADVRVRSAGGGAAAGNDHEKQEKSGHIGYFRGVDGASAIRDLILERLKKQRDAGIGDGEAVAETAALPAREPAPELLDAARELLAEARALRRTLTP